MAKAKSSSENPKTEALEEAVEEAKDALEELAESERMEELRNKAAAAGQRVKASAHVTADKVSDALRNTSESLKDGTFKEQTFGRMADALADVSEQLKDTSLDDVGRTAKNAATRHPFLFFGAAALLGFAIGLLLSRNSDSDHS